MKKCPHMLKSDHSGLRNSKVKLMWWWVSRWYEMIAETVQILTEFICWFIALLKSLLSLKSDLVSQTNLKRLQFGPQKCLKLHVGRKCQTCPELPIDTWKLEKSFEKVTSVWGQMLRLLCSAVLSWAQLGRSLSIKIMTRSKLFFKHFWIEFEVQRSWRSLGNGRSWTSWRT